MDWKEYEAVTKQIYETLGRDKGVIIECYGNKCRVKGKSGIDHQIDVLATHSDGLHTYKTAIECKYCEENINKDIVMKVAEIIEDAGISKGVIVSKKGFTPDGISFAKYKSIGLVELREVRDEDWEGMIETISIEMNMLVPQITEFQIVVPEIPHDFNVKSESIDLFEVVHSDDSREEIKFYAKEFISELCKKEEDETLEKIIKLKEGAKLHHKSTRKTMPIHGFKFRGILLGGKEEILISGKDHVWLIMKSIFEGKRYTISKNGEINEKE